MITSKQRGFHIIELAIALLIVGLIGFVGYKVWSRGDHGTAANSTGIPNVPVVKKAGDLKKAGQAVDQVNISSDEAELTQLETELGAL